MNNKRNSNKGSNLTTKERLQNYVIVFAVILAMAISAGILFAMSLGIVNVWLVLLLLACVVIIITYVEVNETRGGLFYRIGWTDFYGNVYSGQQKKQRRYRKRQLKKSQSQRSIDHIFDYCNYNKK